MKGKILGAVLLIAAAAMMGCTDSIMPCATDDDCTINWGPGDSEAAHDWEGPNLVCNTDYSPLEMCEDMLSYLDWLPDWIPFMDWIILPDCTELYGEGTEYYGMGTCGSSWGPW